MKLYALIAVVLTGAFSLQAHPVAADQPAVSSPAVSDQLARHDQIDGNLSEQRELYQKALKALKKGPGPQFQQLKKQLKDYPLYPYLEYADIAVRIRTLPKKEVNQFLADNDGTRVADRLRVRWLDEMKRRRRGADFIEYYQPSLADTEFQCYYHYARYHTGDEQQQQAALDDAMTLWLVGESQPKECDKLFELLQDNNRIDTAAAWKRFSLAVSNRKYSLAKYLQRFITEQPHKQQANNAIAATSNFRKIGKYQDFSDKNPETLTILEHFLLRLAYQDGRTAMKYWGHYHQTHPFSVKSQSRITTGLVKALYRQNDLKAADEYLQSSLDLVDPDLIEWRIRQSLQTNDWQTAITWIDRLPGEYRQENRWRYWHARLSDHLNGTDPATVYAELAQQRSYYGFLASEHLGGHYAMEHKPIAPSEEEIQVIAAMPGIQMARELHYHGERLNARREWYDATRNFSEKQWIAAAVLTHRWQWINQSIMSMVQASYWNDIQIRFPLTYLEEMQKHTEPLKMDTHLLLALARQESALAEDAVSPAGARGLMQLMPATAKQTARRHNIKYSGIDDLLLAEKNIELGTRYYKELLDTFDNNRILATAAYNAGPHRVQQWLKVSGKQLSYDAWIETIPFRETRNYVQNVLAFSAIYAHLLGNNTRILSNQEKQMML